MTDTQDIRRALEGRLNDGSYTGITNSSDIAWENVAFDSSQKTKWLRPRLNISEIVPATAGNTPTELWSGLFIIDCYTKQNTGGTAGLDVLADEVKAQFAKGLQITENSKIINIRYSQLSRSLQIDPWYVRSFTAFWYSYI